MAAVYLDKKRKRRLEAGHPWIFQSEVERTEGDPIAGQLLSVHTHNGQYMATGYWNPTSQIVVRIVSYEPLEAMTHAFLLINLKFVWSIENVLCRTHAHTGLCMEKRTDCLG